MAVLLLGSDNPEGEGEKPGEEGGGKIKNKGRDTRGKVNKCQPARPIYSPRHFDSSKSAAYYRSVNPRRRERASERASGSRQDGTAAAKQRRGRTDGRTAAADGLTLWPQIIITAVIIMVAVFLHDPLLPLLGAA